METLSVMKNRVLEKVTDFMDKAPGLASLIVTLVIVAGFIG